MFFRVSVLESFANFIIRVRVFKIFKIEASRGFAANEKFSILKYTLDIFSLVIYWKSFPNKAEDTCYPQDVMKGFKNFRVSSADDVLSAYNLMLLVNKSFNVETFYPQFCNAFNSTEKRYESLGSYGSLLLSFEVANPGLENNLLLSARFFERAIWFARPIRHAKKNGRIKANSMWTSDRETTRNSNFCSLLPK